MAFVSAYDKKDADKRKDGMTKCKTFCTDMAVSLPAIMQTALGKERQHEVQSFRFIPYLEVQMLLQSAHTHAFDVNNATEEISTK